FLGIDSSTQSISALIIDPASGTVVADESVNFGKDLPQYGAPSGFIPGGENGEVHSDPLMWLEALDLLFATLSATAGLSSVSLIGGSGPQHGSVYLNSGLDAALGEIDASQGLAGQVAATLSRPTSPIWMDTSTGKECAEITASLGGQEEVCARS